MGEEEAKQAAPETAPPPPEAVKDVTEEKAPIPPPKADEIPDESKALAIVEKFPLPSEVQDPPKEKSSGGSIDRDAALAKLESEKRLSLILAWEENEKTKADNKAVKKLSSITAWENSKKAAVEAELKKKEEALEKQKAEYAEKMKNQIALLHKEAEEKRAMVEARRGEELLKAEEQAAKYRATGLAPKKLLGCFQA